MMDRCERLAAMDHRGGGMMTCALLFAGARELVGLGAERMLNLLLRAFAITLGLTGPAMAQERILISSDWGKVTAELVDNDATRSLVQMLPLTSKCATTSVRKRPAICLRPCPRSSGSSISRPVRWDFGAPIISSSTIATGACLSRGLSCSAEQPATCLFSAGRVRSPSE